MPELTDKINFEEVEYLYKSPDTMVDYSDVVSFTLIKSSVEIFQYYGITSFSADNIKRFFEYSRDVIRILDKIAVFDKGFRSTPHVSLLEHISSKQFA